MHPILHYKGTVIDSHLASNWFRDQIDRPPDAAKVINVITLPTMTMP